MTLYINEWMAANAGVIVDPADGNWDDWFEIYNPTTNRVDLADYTLTDTLAVPGKFRIPAGYSIAPQSYLLVWADEETAQSATNGELHVNFKLSQSGEAIGLYAPDGTAVNTVTFSRQTNNISQGRWPDGAAAPTSSCPRRPRAPRTRCRRSTRASSPSRSMETPRPSPGVRSLDESIASSSKTT